MAVTLCPHCGLEVESDESVAGRFECPHCGKELGEIDEEKVPESKTSMSGRMGGYPIQQSAENQSSFEVVRCIFVNFRYHQMIG